MSDAMSDVVSNRQVVTNLLEREVGNLYEQLRSQALSLTNGQPLIKKVAENYIQANERQWLAVIQEKLDLIIEASFINPEASIEEALATANDLINTGISQFLEDKFNIPTATLNIALQSLFGISL